jgi:hypothetical protein
MFTWLKRLFGCESSSNNVHIYLHVDGKLSIENEARPGNTVMVDQRPINPDAAPKTSEGSGKTTRDFEADITPGLFADTRETEASFGTEVELPPKDDQNSGI